MNTASKKEFILSIFQNTDLDFAFIEAANSLGYTKYFTNLNLDKCKIGICYNRVVQIIKIINPELLKKNILNTELSH